jgi:hypothetical protein
MSITKRIAASLSRLWSLFRQKENSMSDQTVIDPTTTQLANTAAASNQALSPAEDFANEIATPVAAPPAVSAAPAVAAEAVAAAPTEAAPAAAPEALASAPTEAAPAAVPEAVTPAPTEVTTDVVPPSVPEAVTPAAADSAPAAATEETSDASQAFTEGVKDFVQALNFVEQGVIKMGDAAKDELIELARKYL